MNPAQHFQRYFRIHRASNKHMLEQAYAVRYQVYCREFGYEDEQRCPRQLEFDQYDTHAQQTLLLHSPSNTPVGCVRLVEANPQMPELPLPFERYCSEALDRDQFDPDEFLPGQLAEFSRLAVVGGFRRRSCDQGREVNLPRPVFVQERQRGHFPVIPVSLFLAALAMLLSSDAEYGVAMIEPRLMRLMRLFGINFEAVGKTMDYHGQRAPYIIHRDNALRYLKPEVDELFFAINQSLQPHSSRDSHYNVA